MTSTLYISGCWSEDKEEVFCPLQSSVILFIAKYCNSRIKLTFVESDNVLRSSNTCSYKVDTLSLSHVEFLSWQDLPKVVRNVCLPSIHQIDQRLVRSGLCVVLRHIIKEAHEQNPSLNLIDLLGFRQGSMKMCAEVSSWTKLCEVDIPYSVTTFITDMKSFQSDRENVGNKTFYLPVELMILENHFKQKCRVHNDNKRQRAAVSQLKDFFDNSLAGVVDSHNVTTKEILDRINSQKAEESKTLLLDTLSFNSSHVFIEKTVELSHSTRKFFVSKSLTPENLKLNSCSQSDYDKVEGVEKGTCFSEKPFDVSDLKSAISKLSYVDIVFEHVYSEGTDLTVADLILITYMYHLLHAMEFVVDAVAKQLDSVLKWTRHMASLEKVNDCAKSVGWNIGQLLNVCRRPSLQRVDASDHCVPNVVLQVTCQDDITEVELNRCAKMKHKALKLEVAATLKKFEESGVQAEVGCHPKGNNVGIDWDSLPAGVHPKEGNVPVKRTERKCQQLENLATAVETLAHPGDIIVDFCSGGGHLGIVCAYLIPDSEVYLVENKEESLLKSSRRLRTLGIDNVTLFQCNMDYFIGQFDVGLCLHACGPATDMVLQLCTQSHASFVVCPCCYGSIHNTHLLQYPRSRRYLDANISSTDFLTIGHAADQTEFDIKLEKQGRTCMNLVDTDRVEYAKEKGYDVTLCSLIPLTCSPKNNLLIGVPQIQKPLLL